MQSKCKSCIIIKLLFIYLVAPAQASHQYCPDKIEEKKNTLADKLLSRELCTLQGKDLLH